MMGQKATAEFVWITLGYANICTTIYIMFCYMHHNFLFLFNSENLFSHCGEGNPVRRCPNLRSKL